MRIKIIPNILSKEGRRTIDPIWEDGKTIRDYLRELKIPIKGKRVIVSGKKIKNLNRPVKRSDEIIVTPVIKDPFTIGLATMAIVGISSMGVPTAAFALTATIVGWAVIGAVVGIATLALVSAFSAPRKPSYGTTSSGSGGLDANSPTYGWDGVQTTQNVGTPVPVIYGEHKAGGNVINQFITSDGDKNYLHTLLALSEGEIEGISDIMINDNPIANFEGVTTAQVLGTNSQDPITGFETLHDINTIAVNLNALDDFHVYTMAGTDSIGYEVLLTFPAGLYYMANSGSVSETSIDIKIEYKLHADVSYTLDGNYTISSMNRSSVRKIFTKTGLPAGKYDIKVTRLTAIGDVNTIRDMTWTHADELRDDSLAYPNTALLAMNFLATDQLSGGTPNITCVVKGRKISTPDIRVSEGGAAVAYDDFYYDPTASAWKKFSDNSVLYWDGTTYVNSYSANPAWVIYDLLTNTRYGLGEFIDSDHVDMATFLEMAKYCDGKVADGNGGYEKRFRMDCVLDSEARSIDVLMQLATTFRAIFFFSENSIQLKIDKPELPVQMFTMGNIVADSFLQKWKSVKDVPNNIQIQFLDKEKNYEQEIISYVDDAALQSGTPLRKKEVRLFCTRTSQAIREARYLLNFSKYVDRSISFKAGIDAIACQVGDVIDFAHDVPQWGYSGRIVSYDSETGKVTLDRSVTIATGKTYVLRIRHGDDTLEEHAVTNAVGAATEITVDEPFSFTPAAYDIYSFGETDLSVKPFRIMALQRDKDNEVQITAVEYNASIYDDSAPALPTSNYSALDNTIADVENLILTEGIIMVGDTGAQTIDVWFTPPDDSGRAMEFRWSGAKIYLSGDERASWHLVGIANAPGFQITGVEPDTKYYVAAVSVAASGMENGITASPQDSITTTAGGSPSLPADVTGTTGVFQGDLLSLSWTPLAVSPKGYEIRDEDANWGTENAHQLYKGVTNSFLFTPGAYSGITYYVKAYTNAGYSATADSVTPTKAIPITVSGFTGTFEGDRLKLAWTPQAITPTGYEIRTEDANWGTADSKQIFQGVSNTTTFLPTAPSGITYYIRAFNIAGYASASASVTPTMPVPDNVTGFSYLFETNNIILSWQPLSFAPANYEVRKADTNWGVANADQIYVGLLTTTTLAATARTGVTYYVKAINTNGVYSATAASVTPTNTAPAAITGLGANVFFNVARFFWTNCADADVTGYQVYKSESNAWAGEETLVAEVPGVQLTVSGHKPRSGNVTTVTSTTVFTVDALIGVADDYFNGDKLLVTSGVNNGTTRTVTDFNGTTGEVTLDEALPNTPDAGDQILITDNVYYKVRAVDYYGVGAFSAAYKVEFEGIDGNMIGDNVVTARNIYVANLSALSASMGCLTSGTIEGGTFQTSGGGERIVMNSDGMYGYNSSCCETLRICTDGTIMAQSAKFYDPACVDNYSYLNSGALTFHDECGDVPYLKRVCAGVDVGETWICLDGWKVAPQVVVSPKSLMSYNCCYAAQSQQWCVFSDGVQTYNVGGKTGYKFQVHASLTLASGQAAPTVVSAAWDTATCTAACVCRTDVCLNMAAWCNNAAPSNYYYGTICYEICYKVSGAGAYCSCCYTFTQPHASSGEIVSTQGVTQTLCFPCMATWDIQVHQICATYTDSGICATVTACCCCCVSLASGLTNRCIGFYMACYSAYCDECWYSCACCTGTLYPSASAPITTAYCAYACVCYCGCFRECASTTYADNAYRGCYNTCTAACLYMRFSGTDVAFYNTSCTIAGMICCSSPCINPPAICACHDIVGVCATCVSLNTQKCLCFCGVEVCAYQYVSQYEWNCTAGTDLQFGHCSSSCAFICITGGCFVRCYYVHSGDAACGLVECVHSVTNTYGCYCIIDCSGQVNWLAISYA